MSPARTEDERGLREASAARNLYAALVCVSVLVVAAVRISTLLKSLVPLRILTGLPSLLNCFSPPGAALSRPVGVRSG